jgi:ferritin-like protein
MKQTAVEWLAEKYDYVYWMVKRDEISPGLAEEWKKHYLEQAKEMENERVTEAYRIGRIGKSIKEFNETFKSE